MIEPARSEDTPRLSELVSQIRPDLPASTFDPARVRQAHRTLVARDENGAAIGFIVTTYTDLGIADEGGGTIELLVVDEAHRDLGVGAELVEAAIEWLRSERVKTVFVSTEADATTPEFYEKLGFELCRGPWMVRVID